MDDRRVGRLIRSARVRKRWRQVDLEAACGVDQSSISLMELGRLDRFTIRSVRQVCDALDVPIELVPRMPAAEITRLLDEGHARLVEHVLALLRDAGWETIAEYTFSHFGERGSVDIVAWHTASRTLLIVEVKTQLMDVQELIGTLDRKVRLVPMLLARERGWKAAHVARLLAVEESATARRVVAAHRVTFDTTFPVRSRDVARWIGRPADGMAGLWFLSSTNGARGNRHATAVRRVRRPRPRSE